MPSGRDPCLKTTTRRHVGGHLQVVSARGESLALDRKPKLLDIRNGRLDLGTWLKTLLAFGVHCFRRSIGMFLLVLGAVRVPVFPADFRFDSLGEGSNLAPV